MRTNKIFSIMAAVVTLLAASSCDSIDNKAVPQFTVRIDLGGFAMWNTYGVGGMGDYRIFDRNKGIPSNFPYNVNTYTGYGGVILMMGIDMPMAYDRTCPVEVSPDIVVSIDPDNLDAVCPKCGSRYNPLTGDGGPVQGVAINNKVGLRKYRVTPLNGGYLISN